MTTFNALVLDAGLRQGLVTARSLGRRKLSVAVLDALDDTPTFSSKWCRKGFPCPAPVATDDYLDCLERVLDQTGPCVLIPLHDGTIELLRRHRERLERRARLALAREPALAVAIDKTLTLEVARSLGIGVPRALVLNGVGDVPAALAEIGLPAVVKPTQSWVDGDAPRTRLCSRLVTTPEEARHAAAELTGFGRTVLFQRFLPGRREAVSFLYAGGKVRARFAQWAKRTSPPLGGESVLRQSIAVPPDIGEQAERLVREIGLEGYSEVEFRRDDAGAPHLMEINPRLSASVEIAVRSGVDFPHLLYQWAAGEPVDTVESYRVGGWMRYLRGDFMATIAALQERGRPGVEPPARVLLDFGLSFFKPMAYDYFDWTDLRPALKAAADFALYMLKRCVKWKV